MAPRARDKTISLGNPRVPEGKGNAFEAVFCRKGQGRGVAGTEGFGFSVRTPVPQGPRRMDDVAGGQGKARGHDGIPRGYRADGAACPKQGGTCCSVDGGVNAAGGGKHGICGIDDGIAMHAGDVLANQGKGHTTTSFGWGMNWINYTTKR